MKEFVKVGNIITPQSQGLEYELEAERCYYLKYDKYEDKSFLLRDGELTLPKKIYGGTGLEERILKSFNSSNKSVGVLLEGLKGSGKTLFSKVLAKKSGLPIIIVDEEYPVQRAVEFFAKIKQPICLLFDELEKNTYFWRTDKLLKLLDGVQPGPKKLTIMTCNNIDNLDDNLKNRCSRIRYYIHYDGLSLSSIQEIVNDVIENESNKNGLADKIFNSVKTKSYDNIISICKEINIFPDMLFEDVMSIMNIDVNSNNLELTNLTMTNEEFRKRIRKLHAEFEKAVDEDDYHKALKIVQETKRLDHEMYDNNE